VINQVFTSTEIKKEIVRMQEEPEQAMPAAAKVQHEAMKAQTIAQLVVAYHLAKLVELGDTPPVKCEV
jgi:hypothetical protein